MLLSLTADRIERRDIALLGEGNFEYAVRMAEAHPHLCEWMFASDVNVNERLGKKHDKASDALRENIATLEGLGVLVGVLDAGHMPAGVRCSWVQFNGPRGNNGAHIPKVIHGLVKWCASHLKKGGTLHISCHGDQRAALSGMRLLQETQKHSLGIVNVNNTLQARSRYTAMRTNGDMFQQSYSKNVWEYVFLRKDDTTYGKPCVDCTPGKRVGRNAAPIEMGRLHRGASSHTKSPVPPAHPMKSAVRPASLVPATCPTKDVMRAATGVCGDDEDASLVSTTRPKKDVMRAVSRVFDGDANDDEHPASLGATICPKKAVMRAATGAFCGGDDDAWLVSAAGPKKDAMRAASHELYRDASDEDNAPLVSQGILKNSDKRIAPGVFCGDTSDEHAASLVSAMHTKNDARRAAPGMLNSGASGDAPLVSATGPNNGDVRARPGVFSDAASDDESAASLVLANDTKKDVKRPAPRPMSYRFDSDTSDDEYAPPVSAADPKQGVKRPAPRTHLFDSDTTDDENAHLMHRGARSHTVSPAQPKRVVHAASLVPTTADAQVDVGRRAPPGFPGDEHSAHLVSAADPKKGPRTYPPRQGVQPKHDGFSTLRRMPLDAGRGGGWDAEAEVEEGLATGGRLLSCACGCVVC
eukprot:TRINITY_DN1104_c0_g1_i4.p1 TRINITY_DN1104_c0_g1~~TRINITY_DN1104_c0_g1_i4.p1  ORF type:complete len:641 (+),score=59.15 TRINITY_DN1104_c0_g1_i4:42-1964(+)